MEAANPLKASLADNSSLLNGKAEGSLSVARAAVADGLQTQPGRASSTPFYTSGKVVADDLSDELWEEIKKVGGTRSETNLMASSSYFYRESETTGPYDVLTYTTIHFPTPFQCGCAVVHIANIRDENGKSLKDNNGQPLEWWVENETINYHEPNTWQSRSFKETTLHKDLFYIELSKTYIFDYIAYGY